MSFDYSLFFYAFGLVIPLGMIIFYPKEITIAELCAHIAAVMLVMFLGYQFGRYVEIADSYVAHGEITGKERVHGWYIETYTCNCSTSGKTTVCSTCTREHYTVDWNAFSTIGKIDLDYRDSLSRSVYSVPDPKIYKECNEGDPASKKFGFSNYVRAVDNSLFADSVNKDERKKLKTEVTRYPNTYDIYKYDHVVQNTGRSYEALNETLSMLSRKYGKEGPNPIVYVVKNLDRDFMRQVEKFWKHGKLNDIVMLVGVDDSDNIVWTDAFSYGKSYRNQDILATVRNYLTDVKKLNTVDKQIEFANAVDGILTKYEKTTSKDFEYLKNEVQPSPGVQWFLIIFGLGLSGGLSYLFHQNDLEDMISRAINRYV